MTTRNWAEGLILALLLAFFDWRFTVLAVAVMWYINVQIQYIESFYQPKDNHAPRNSDGTPRASS